MTTRLCRVTDESVDVESVEKIATITANRITVDEQVVAQFKRRKIGTCGAESADCSDAVAH